MMRVHDRCDNGQPLKCLGLVDEYTRECLALEADGRIDAQRVIEIVEQAMKQYGTPQFLRSDNGPELVAEAQQAWLAHSKRGQATLSVHFWCQGLLYSC